MSILQIDLSEYDAMRKSLKDAENRIEELKEENKDLKKSSKIIFRREVEYLSPMIDMYKFGQAIKNEIQSYEYSGLRLNIERLAAICIEVWKKFPKEYSKVVPTTEKVPMQSDTLIGFDDVRLKIEEMFKEQFTKEHQQAIRELNLEKDTYKTKYNSIYDEISGKFKSTIKRLKEENNKLKEELKESKEANKDNEVKLAESEEKVKELQEELNKLKTKKKHWFGK